MADILNIAGHQIRPTVEQKREYDRLCTELDEKTREIDNRRPKCIPGVLDGRGPDPTIELRYEYEAKVYDLFDIPLKDRPSRSLKYAEHK